MLTKPLITTIIPGTAGSPGQAASTTCTPNQPPVTPPPEVPPTGTQTAKYIYVPSNPAVYVSETRTPYYGETPPPGYGAFSCTTYWVPDPAFSEIGGLMPVYECRAYWIYP